MGGRGGSGGFSGGVNADYNRVMNPKTIQDYSLKQDVIIEYGNNNDATYEYVDASRDWENYGKSRTYFKINVFRRDDGKLHHSIDNGYYDNKANKMVDNAKYSNFTDDKLWLRGSSLSEKDIKETLKSIRKNSKK